MNRKSEGGAHEHSVGIQFPDGFAKETKFVETEDRDFASDWDLQTPLWRGPYMWLLLAISGIGTVTSVLVGRGLTHAQQHIARLDRWWYCEDRTQLTMDMLDKDMYPDGASRLELTRRRLALHPPLQGQTRSSVEARLINPYNLPWCFVVAWLLIPLIMILLWKPA